MRDFSYSADQQSRMLDAARAVSEDIVVSLKNTPHDYYPTFPDNPRIGHTGGLRQWIEFDTWGQFFGLGIFPVSVVEDMQRRMQHALASGAEGIALRTDWEVITDAGAFNSPNILNVIGGAMLAQDADRDLAEVYDAFAAHGVYSPLREASVLRPPVRPVHPEGARILEQFMQRSWAVMEKAAYVRGHLFHEDDQYPDSVGKAIDMLVNIHGRDDWEPGASRLLEPTVENLEIIFSEKRTAVELVDQLPALLRLDALGLDGTTTSDMWTMLDLYALYVRGYALCADAVFRCTHAQQFPSDQAREQARRTVGPLRTFGEQVRERLEGTSLPHVVYWLLDTRRTDALAADVERRLDAVG